MLKKELDEIKAKAAEKTADVPTLLAERDNLRYVLFSEFNPKFMITFHTQTEYPAILDSQSLMLRTESGPPPRLSVP